MSRNDPDTLITLTVDTDGITTDPNTINNHVVFTDNQSDPLENPGHPESYVSTVNISSQKRPIICEWQGVAKNKTDKINIINVIKKAEGGNDILKTPIPQGVRDPQRENKVTVTARVIDKFLSGDEKYTVSFTINDDPTVYPVDPRIKMKEQTG